MLTAPRISLEEDTSDYERASSDFTPDDRRTFRRSLYIQTGRKGSSGLRLRLSEWDWASPDRVDIALYIEKPAGYANQAFLESPLSVAQLDGIIEALTLARDIAICEGMIAPAVGKQIA